MHVAVIGTGIAGMSAAHRLCSNHELTVFEAGAHVGGHTNTVTFAEDERELAIDTGFIVFNNRTYPGFSSLLARLGVATQASEMSFSVSDASRDFEYAGTSLNALYAQRRNLLRASFNRMLLDILRFNRVAPDFIAAGDEHTTLGEYLRQGEYGSEFVQRYIVPMGAAIWSMRPAAMFDFPALCFLRFFANHGLLQLRDRPRWRTVTGGSVRYVDHLTAPYRDRILLRHPVRAVQRRPGGVRVTTDAGTKLFDAVLFACHSDEVLRLLDRPTRAERSILGAIAYQPNEAVVHTDTRLLPRRRRAWAAWNYRLGAAGSGRATLTYNMNILQRLDSERTYCVTLNDTGAIDPAHALARFAYDHPVYTRASIAAQQRYPEINGLDRVYYCGAYWGYGFHEDGYQSAQRACAQLERDFDDGKLHLRRVG